MKTILVVHDMAIIREPIAASLRMAGYNVVTAADGAQAIAANQLVRPDLILLDVLMPGMDGITLLKRIQKRSATRTPVILLTAASGKQHVLEAAKLGVRDYLLKSTFSLNDLLKRIKKHLAEQEQPAPPAKAAEPPPSAAEPPPPGMAAAPPPLPPAQTDGPIPRLLTREQCILRTEQAMQAKTLSGIVAQVISQAASPRSDLAELAVLIGRDPILSARVLQAANSAAYASNRGAVTTIPDAVRNIGCTAITNIASTLGIFDAFPDAGADGFHPVRCWQHSFAVAQLCERLMSLADPKQAGLAYLVGLCHDLGAILFHTFFAAEYRRVLEIERRTGRPREELESRMLGLRQGEAAMIILKQLKLPETILGPIEAHHAGEVADAPPLARVLRIAETCANALQLASSGRSPIVPITRTEYRSAVGDAPALQLDAQSLRAEVLALTLVLGRLPRAEEKKLAAPLYPRSPLRVWFARDRGLSPFDPLQMLLESLARTQTCERLPYSRELADFDLLVVAARTASAAGFSGPELATALSGREPSCPCLWLVGRQDAFAPRQAPQITPIPWPVTIDRIAEFLDSAQGARTANAA